MPVAYQLNSHTTPSAIVLSQDIEDTCCKTLCTGQANWGPAPGPSPWF